MKLRTAYVVTRDMDRAAQFYEGLLGAKPAFRDGDNWTQYAGEGGSFALSSVGEAAQTAQSTVAVFQVDDLDAGAAAIEAGGGKVLERRDMGDHGTTLSFEDPDGNVAQLFAKN